MGALVRVTSFQSREVMYTRDTAAKALLSIRAERTFAQGHPGGLIKRVGRSESLVFDDMVSDLITVSAAWPTRLS
jgi:hypothetical protein